jgi:tRNA A-37 threonylcarbamoyl transferase component Bud32
METDTLIGKTIHTNLFIKSKLGEGGMGTVYLAENAALREKKYAVKVLRRELTDKAGFRERFYEEAQHQAQLDHPNIVQMYDYFNIGDDYFLILEFVDGQALDAMIDTSNGPLPEKRTLSIIRDVLAGLNCAHEKGILHRDVKPSNVMIDASGRARLTDFGIARQFGGTGRSEAGMTLGTPEYMSPEQIQEPDTVDHRTDVYSAGILLFEMLTGKVPFDGPSQKDIQQKQLNAPVPDPRTRNPRIKKRLAGIVSKAMHKKPDERFQGCLEFRKAIDAYAQPKAPLWALAVFLVLVSIALAFHFFITLPETVQVVRGHAKSAASNYALLCQQAKTLPMKQTGMRLASESGNSGLADDFARQVADISANMNDFAGNYVKQISAMKAYDPGTVQRVLSEIPADDDVPDRAHYWQMAVRDYGNLAAGRALPDMPAMIGDCAQ